MLGMPQHIFNHFLTINQPSKKSTSISEKFKIRNRLSIRFSKLNPPFRNMAFIAPTRIGMTANNIEKIRNHSFNFINLFWLVCFSISTSLNINFKPLTNRPCRALKIYPLRSIIFCIASSRFFVFKAIPYCYPQRIFDAINIHLSYQDS